MQDTSTGSAAPRTDRLVLIQQLSGGSVGIVYKAKNPKSETIVAMRQFQVPEWLDDVDGLLKRILAEARSANALDHPNIARLSTGGYKGHTVFFTAEFVEGPTLREYLANQKPGMAELLPLAKQLCDALDYAHQKGVIHHSLTLSNLKIVDGKLKVLDFGLIRDKEIYAPTPAKRLENEHYLSPEQVRHKPPDRASNLFTAAGIFYEMFTTRHPFAGKHLGEVDKNITDSEPHPLNVAHPRVSDAISRVVLKGLSKQPHERFQSGRDMAAALEEAFNGATVRTGSNPAATSTGTRIPAAPAPQAAPVKPVLKPVPPAPAMQPAVPQVSNPAASLSAQVSTGSSWPAAQPSAVSSSTSMQAAAAMPAMAPSNAPAEASATGTASRKAASAPAKVSQTPVKLLMQWKLAAAVVVGLFVVVVLAMALGRRTTVPPPVAADPTPSPVAPSVAVATPEPQPVETATASDPASVPVAESHSSASGRKKPVKVQPTPSGPVGPVASATLTVNSTPSGALIEIAGRSGESWTTPQTLASLVPGVYKVTISKSGYGAETRSIEIGNGFHATLDVTLAATRGALNIAGSPAGASILIDGKDTGKLSPAEFTLDPAVHSVTLKKDGYFDSSADIKVLAGQAVSYSPSMKSAGRTDNIKVVGGGIKKIFGNNSGQGMCRVEFKTEPKGAQIVINGSVFSKVTPVEIQVEPGNYEIILQKDGYKPVHRSITAQANDKVKVEEQMTK
ncbi:MAG TPA: PEGA domain-containing protein [Candidatus Angelobacter sp.]|nr:PEGA domain-containing protein [Candidatus Angelobacter sp.]